MKVIIIGCTHAGTAAAKTMLTENDDIDVTIYERNDNVSFLSCGIALYVGGTVKDVDGLFYSSPDELQALGADVHMEHEVTELDQAAKTLKVKDLKTGEEFEDSYDKLVMTTGSWPIIPPLDHLDAENLLICRNFHHAQNLIQNKTDKQKIAVIGGGYIGVELVEAFQKDGKDVTLIDAENHILSKYLDTELIEHLESDMKRPALTLPLAKKLPALKWMGKTFSEPLKLRRKGLRWTWLSFAWASNPLPTSLAP